MASILVTRELYIRVNVLIMLLFSFVLGVFLSFDTSARDETQYSSESGYYPSNKDIYEDCTHAIEIGDKGDIRTFMHTYCASQITGYLIGYMRMMPSQLVTTRMNDPCEHVLEGIHQSYESVICIPKEWWKSKTVPIELRIARDLTFYLQKQRGDDLFTKPNTRPFSADISAIYPCNHKTR
jgi:hypothetical protein